VNEEQISSLLILINQKPFQEKAFPKKSKGHITIIANKNATGTNINEKINLKMSKT
jgi:hypothetical protein